MSDLDAANAAPPASDKERKSALGWVVGAFVIGLFAVILAMFYGYKSHKADVAKIETSPVALPPLVKPSIKAQSKKQATKSIATEESITPPKADFWIIGKTEKPVAKPVNQDNFTSEFEKKLVEFERKIP